MERSCPDWHLRPASLPLSQLPEPSASTPDSANTHAPQRLPPSPLMAASAPSSIPRAALPTQSPLPAHPSTPATDASVLSTCRTLVAMLAHGGHSLLQTELERTVLWKSRQTPDATMAAWHATHGFLSLLSGSPCDDALRHNLATFARCVDLLGYRARSFILSPGSAPHLKITWRSGPAHAAPAGTFSNQEEFVPVDSEPNADDPNSHAVIVIHREERALTAAYSKPRPNSGDTMTYMIPRNSQSWPAPAAADSAQQLITPQRTHIASPLQQSSQQLHQLPLTHDQVYGVERRPHASLQQSTSAQDSLATNFFGVDDRARAPFPHARALPPLTGHAAALPSVHELESRQSRGDDSERLRSMPVLGLHSPAQRAEPLVTAQANSLGRALSLGQALDARPQDYLFGAAGLTQEQNPWNVAGVSTITTAIAQDAGAATSTPSYIRRTRGGAAAEQRQCANCSTRVTRQWVRGERSCWLCHSCGQFWRKNGYGRPAGLWNRPKFKRSRRKRSTSSASSSGTTSDAPVSHIAAGSMPAPSATVALTGVQPLLPHLGGGGGERGSQP